MGFGAAVSTCLSKYATFSGRARRSEFWWFYLFYVVAAFAGAAIDAVAGTDPLFYLVALLAFLLPGIAVSIRRLHDLDKSGWFYLVFLIPLIGFILMIVFYVQEGTTGANEYGPDPRAAALDG